MRALLLVVSGLVLAGALWLLVGRGEPAQPMPFSPANESSEASESTKSAAPEAEPPGVEGPGPSARTEVAASPPIEVGEGRVAYRVRVVHASTGEPVVGAAVSWLPVTFDHSAVSTEDGEAARADYAAFVAKFGETRVADSQGRLSIPAFPQGVAVYGRHGSLFGQTHFRVLEPGKEEVSPEDLQREFVLKLAEDLTLVARAVDRGGQPLRGVTMTLKTVGSEQSYGRQLHPTDAQGLTYARHAQNQFADAETVSLEPALFGGTGEPTVVSRQDLSAEPIDVVVPASGSLEVVLIGPDGRLWELAEGTNMTVQIQPAGEQRGGIVNPHNSVSLGRDGRAIAEPVLCGQEFGVKLWVGAMLDEKVTGPTRAGERVRVELRMPLDVPVLVGRVVDAKGSPVTSAFYFSCEYSRGSSTSIVGTGADGSFRSALSEQLVGERPTFSLTRLKENYQRSDQVASMILSAPVHAGANLAGDIVLGSAPVLVAGRVERMDGTPVEAPRVEVQRTRGGASARWEQAWELRPETPGDGRFVVRGVAAPDKRYRLHVQGNFAPIEPVEFAPGAEDLVLRVGEGGSVTARFLVDESTPWQRLKYRLAPTLEISQERDSLRRQREWAQQGHPQPVENGAICQWRSLAPGSYRLTVQCPGLAEPLVEVPDIVVPSGGGAAVDARLEGLDLRGRVREFVVEVTDASGAAVHAERNAAVLIRGADDDSATWYGRALESEKGKVELLAVRPVDLVVVAPGFRPKDVVGVFADTLVTLERVPQIRLRLAGGLPQMPAGVEVRLRVRVEGAPRRGGPRVRVERRGGSSGMGLDSLLGARSQSLAFGEDGDIVLTPRDSKARKLRLFFYRRAGRDVRREYVAVTPAVLELAGLRDGQVIELRCDAAALRAAVAKVGGD